uniref:Cysteine--tRNA ligase n=1 Tax=Candidatus Kentrum sp. TUN TaxID=2126343 RepID=A0A451AWL2_9GAMM|nr:MAG: cysteinyl-tRNA synthetase [Candidatus Kentron sp. TUN]VFK63455.1 MAG: cysteinyl-tRNA synthetase [Candidatus Kentron sp. TUN]VFK70440.1 MAG: cysteinyl-tRNA synthetase [Candidatus Kentron sp. TUN]
MLRIFNTLTNKKECFEPIIPGKVRMYVCGMTVYDYCHLGHARVLVVFDVIVRYLRSLGFDVTYVRNITDIDDKIIQRANDIGEDFQELTHRFIKAMHEDEAVLGVSRPDVEPRATRSIKDILHMIETLVAKKYAYVESGGDVYYDVSSFSSYGQLSGKCIDDLQAGVRVEINEAKEDPLDFVLWKAAKPGEPSWDSPWGPGRPGWHIECSAMSTGCLGNHFDIHGGGMDLKFPHHENEIAQSEAATGEPFVNTWVHNGFVRVSDEKMSKSLGNFFTVRQVLEQYPAEVARYFIVASQYRSPLNYSEQQLEQAWAGLSRLYIALRDIPHAERNSDTHMEYDDRFRAAMDDDFNTPEALAVLFEMAREINRARQENNIQRVTDLGTALREFGKILGLLQDDPERFLQGTTTRMSDDMFDNEKIDQLIAERVHARACKDWSKADEIRDKLKAQGIVLEDSGGKTIWRRDS